MAVNDHAPLAPSSAHIWGAEKGCRASVRMQQAYPQLEDSPEAMEGTAAHWYVTEALQGRPVTVGAVAPNGYPVNAEMIDAGAEFIRDVTDTWRASLAEDPDTRTYVETRVTMANSVHMENHGTPDVRMVLPRKRRLHVWDYKYGHRYVSAAENLQLLDYAIGALEAEGCFITAPHGTPQSFFDWRISVTIAQPRNYAPEGPMREWYLSGAQLAERFVPQLRQAATEAMQPDAPMTTGPFCVDCSAAHACPAAQRMGAFAMDISMRAQPVDLPPHAVGLELRLLTDAENRLKARKTALEEHALGLIRGGTIVPFYTVEPTTGRERWALPADQVILIGKNLGVDLSSPGALTPKQARAAGVPDAAIEGLTETPRGALRLKRVEDNAAALAFGHESQRKDK